MEQKELENITNAVEEEEKEAVKDSPSVNTPIKLDQINVQTPKRGRGRRPKALIAQLEQNSQDASTVKSTPSKLAKEKKTKQDQSNDFINLFQRRSTRSQAKEDGIEMLTEPLIYSCRKQRKKSKYLDTNNKSTFR